MQKSWFKDWFNSHYYHLLYQHRDEEEALSFIQRLILHLHPSPGAKMLDVACGKGRHSKALADNGFDVTGIDLSEESIIEAK
jgi:2-polyprenyl-3-methyl-5-hydroxy-6-metoxy-1,4-benzoquinol methylase